MERSLVPNSLYIYLEESPIIVIGAYCHVSVDRIWNLLLHITMTETHYPFFRLIIFSSLLYVL